MQNRELEELSGSVEEIIFQNTDNGFTVLELNIGEELITVVGELLGVSEGEELNLVGRFTTHPTYGSQFKVEAYERSMPATASAIRKYLASGVIKGIGPALAQKIVDRFGDETLEIMESQPLRLAEVKGITLQKAEKLSEELRQIFGVRAVMLFLGKYGLQPGQSVSAWKKWGSLTMEILQNNPFLLCSEDIGVRFEDADQIAEEMGFPPEYPERIKCGMLWVLRYNENNGYTMLPKDQLLSLSGRLLGLDDSVVENTLAELLESHQLYGVQWNKEYIYRPEYFFAETGSAARIALMLKEGPSADLDPEETERLIAGEEKRSGIAYEHLQRKAIAQALSNRIFILTGGPGTGKTTTLNAIVSILEQQGLQVTIAAPTGRAAKRIAELTGHDAKTIHRMLGVQIGKNSGHGFIHNEANPLKSDVIVIDEMSMVDTLLFDALLKAAKKGCRLILVGDSDQLPSVGAGNVLKDLIDSDCIPVVELREIFRQAAQSLIITNAHAIVSGEIPCLDDKTNDFFFMPRTSTEAAGQTVVDLCTERLPASYGYSPLEDIQVLCPTRKGEMGTVELNRRLQAKFNPKSPEKAEFSFGAYTFRVGDKVMQVRNNYDIEWNKDEETGTGIYNGDIGIIRMIDRNAGVMAIDFDKRIAYYTFDLAKELDLAYAVTVHKSQGNEFNAVILPLMGGYEKLYYRNLLYTAVTRARKILIIVGSRYWVEYMVHNNKKLLRYTGLKNFIRQMVLGEGEK